MNSLIIDNVDEHLLTLLSMQAARQGCTAEQQALNILRSVLESHAVGFSFAQKIAQRFAGMDTTELASPTCRVVKLPTPLVDAS